MANSAEDFEHERLSDALATARDAVHHLKESCDHVIETAIDDLTQTIHQIKAAPLPEKGWFARLGARWTRYRQSHKLQREIRFFEEVKKHVAAALVDNYRHAEKLTDKVLQDIQQLYARGEDLLGQSPIVQELTLQIKAARRQFRQKLLQCIQDIDSELDRLRDSLANQADKKEIKGLMQEAAFSDSQTLSHLENVSHRARLIAAPPAMTAEPAPAPTAQAEEPQPAQPQEEEPVVPAAETEYMMPPLHEEVPVVPEEKWEEPEPQPEPSLPPAPVHVPEEEEKHEEEAVVATAHEEPEPSPEPEPVIAQEEEEPAALNPDEKYMPPPNLPAVEEAVETLPAETESQTEHLPEVYEHEEEDIFTVPIEEAEHAEEEPKPKLESEEDDQSKAM